MSRSFSEKVKSSKLTELEKEFLLYNYWRSWVSNWKKNQAYILVGGELLDEHYHRNELRPYELAEGDVSRFERKT